MPGDAPPTASPPPSIAYGFTLAFIGAVSSPMLVPGRWTGLFAAICIAASPWTRRARGILLAAAIGLLCGALAAAKPIGSIVAVPPATALTDLRGRVQERIAGMYPEPHGSLLMGILTGDRSGLPREVVDAFRTTGLSHILAVSGSNITMVVSLLQSVLFFLPIKRRLLPAGVGVVLFVLFVGPSASVIRAAVMGMIGLLALGVERPVHPRLAILWAACAMLAWEPSWIREDAGFQLSFLAVIGLTELSDAIKPWLKRVPEALGLRDALLATLAAQATTTPLSALLFGNVPLLSPLANILAAPLIAPSMLLGGLSVLAGLVWEPLGALLAAAAWLPMECILLPSRLIASLPFATWDPGNLTPWLAGMWYAALMGWWLRRERRLTTCTGTASTPSPPALPVSRGSACSGT